MYLFIDQTNTPVVRYLQLKKLIAEKPQCTCGTDMAIVEAASDIRDKWDLAAK